VQLPIYRAGFVFADDEVERDEADDPARADLAEIATRRR
jgi:hypothetical protein